MNLAHKLTGLRELLQFENRWHLVMSRLFFPHEKINIYRYKGLEFLADNSAGDANGAREVLTGETYRKYLKEINFNGSPINVFDVGASIGGFLFLLRSEHIDIEKLVCVEMNPKTFSRLRFNIDRNFDCQAELINGAVCGEHEILEVMLGDGNPGDSLLGNRPEEAGSRRPVKLQGYTFDEIYQASFGDGLVDLCKIDIEGAEIQIFTNPGHDLIKKCRYVLMEIHGGRGPYREPVRQEMARLGFTEIDGEEKTEAKDYVHFFRNDHF